MELQLQTKYNKIDNLTQVTSEVKFEETLKRADRAGAEKDATEKLTKARNYLYNVILTIIYYV